VEKEDFKMMGFRIIFFILFTFLVSCGVAGDPVRPDSVKEISG
jgi:hypothetical protein